MRVTVTPDQIQAAFEAVKDDPSFDESRGLLWALMLALPFPFIANTAGWMTSELGRQPWLIYGLFRTASGYSRSVNPGDVLFTIIGLTGLYVVLSLLYLFLAGRLIAQGPAADHAAGYGELEPAA